MKTIAVIDDEPFIGDMLEKALRENLLMSGAADYVTKPFEIKELLARIAIRLRGSGASGDGEVLSCEEIELRPASRSVTVHGQEARLTRTEYAILRLLMQNAGQVLTRSTLLDRISIDTPDCTESSLKIHVSNLRGSCRYQAGDRELKNAVTNIAHDLRTPLTAISGYLEMLSDEDLPSNVRGDLDIIANRVEALKTLTEEMLHYSVANADHAYEGREEVELRGEIETCVAGFYGALTERGISPEIQLPAYPVTRILNRIALGRILGNIMTNALR